MIFVLIDQRQPINDNFKETLRRQNKILIKRKRGKDKNEIGKSQC